jgi:hypothetical protein
MPSIERIFAAVMLAVAALSDGAALAGNATAAATKNSAPVRPAAKSSELSPSALGMDDDKDKLQKPDDEKPELKLPDHINFGDNVLHFDTSRKNPVPRVGAEANDQAVLNKAPEESPLKPNYFGLRFTTPLH